MTFMFKVPYTNHLIYLHNCRHQVTDNSHCSTLQTDQSTQLQLLTTDNATKP